MPTSGPPNQSPELQIRMLNLHRPWRMERTYPPKKLNVAIGAVHSQIAASGNDVYATWEAIGQGGNTDIFFAQGR